MEDVPFENWKACVRVCMCVFLCLCALPFVAPLLMNCQLPQCALYRGQYKMSSVTDAPFTKSTTLDLSYKVSMETK